MLHSGEYGSRPLTISISGIAVYMNSIVVSCLDKFTVEPPCTWKAVFINIGFDHWFLDNEFNRMYLVETRVSSLAKAFAVLAILITVMGVFGLASYTAEQRTKEVGIRKVLGASVSNIVGLLSKDFVKLILVSFVIAFPIAWWAMSKWLEAFAYRINIEWNIFAIAGVFTLLISLLTVSYQAIKAAVANPVKSLRTE